MAEKDKKVLQNANNSEEIEFEETYLTRGQLVWRAFKKHKLGMISLVVLVILYFMAIFADFLAPYDPYEQSLAHSLIAPTKLHWKYKGEVTSPYVLPTVSFIDPFRSMREFYEMLYPLKVVFEGKEYGIGNGYVINAGKKIAISPEDRLTPYFVVEDIIHVKTVDGQSFTFRRESVTDYLLFGYNDELLKKGRMKVDLNFPTAREAILNKIEFKEFGDTLKSAGIEKENQIESMWKESVLKKFAIRLQSYSKFSMDIDELVRGLPGSEGMKKLILASKGSAQANNIMRVLLLRLVTKKDKKLMEELSKGLHLEGYDLTNPQVVFKLMKRLGFRVEGNTIYIERKVLKDVVSLDLNGKGVEDFDYRRYNFKFFVKSWEGKLLWIFPLRWHLFGVDIPKGDPAAPYVKYYLMGADNFGRDQWSRIVFASRISLSIGLIGMFITFALALVFGGISGYYGGIVDEAMMRVAEIIMSIPGFYLLILLRALLPMDIPSTQIYMLLVFILSFIGWAGTSRVIRGMVLSIRQREFVEAAIVIGLPDFKVLWKHVLPNTTSFMIVAATLRIPGYILGEAGLSYLGLGIREPDASWGLMLAQAQDVYVLQHAAWLLIPGAFIFVTVLAFNFVGDALRDALDPRSLG